ncbi:fumarylacetoacetate hydrolase family protein [Rhodocaloribacter litoris]|uniref:fumarylacetoacetate hydrolase family protein n=1 Tax=Rhodocaloribacter litoris TaxID=2558931 RepID=UPI00142005A4|nr:fumarylacetoacetate hydrolase family protein [Rhodocaloribacter litoris]QXD15395.1 fumarylacetoacetate hydrolase family protein [Rhodocaloribacter litoris]
MKFVTFEHETGRLRAGWLQDDGVIDMQRAHSDLPADLLAFIDLGPEALDFALSLDVEPHCRLSEVRLHAPLPRPRSIRDFVAFEEHMLNCSRTFGYPVAPAWYEMPIFYFTNHHAILGPEDPVRRPAGETHLDFELEVACVIGRPGADIPVEEASGYIFGYMIFNDWTARSIQRREMTVMLGPHKGKDFANAFGPFLVTRDELTPRETGDGRLDLGMTARINGKTVCENNFRTIYHPFAHMIARASANGVTLRPGDVLGSGTVGHGSLVEDDFRRHRPLQPGDVVELEVEGLGILRNPVA